MHDNLQTTPSCPSDTVGNKNSFSPPSPFFLPTRKSNYARVIYKRGGGGSVSYVSVRLLQLRTALGLPSRPARARSAKSRSRTIENLNVAETHENEHKRRRRNFSLPLQSLTLTASSYTIRFLKETMSQLSIHCQKEYKKYPPLLEEIIPLFSSTVFHLVPAFDSSALFFPRLLFHICIAANDEDEGKRSMKRNRLPTRPGTHAAKKGKRSPRYRPRKGP